MSFDTIIKSVGLPSTIPPSGQLPPPAPQLPQIPNPAAFFVNPTTAATADSTDLQSRMGSIFPASMFPVGSNPIESATSVTTMSISYSSTKMTSIVTELPMMNGASQAAAQLSAHAATLDAVQNPTASSAAAITAAFSQTTKGPQAGCPSVSDGFKALLHGVSDAAHAVETGIGSSIAGASDAVKSLISSVIGPFADGPSFITAIKGASSGQLAALTTSIEAAGATILADLQSAGGALSSAAGSALSGLTSAIADEAKAVADSLAYLVGANMLNLFSGGSDCTKTVLSSVVNPTIVPPDTASILASPVTSYTTPTTDAIATVTPVREIAPGVHLKVKDPPPAPTGDYIPYSQTELDGFDDTVQNARETYSDDKSTAATWVKTNIEDWKVANGYQAKGVAAGASDTVPYGTSTDPAVLLAWKTVKDQADVLTNTYNTTILPPLKEEARILALYVKERDRRKQFGKEPYSYLAAHGMPVPDDQQTTYLDSGI